jgi:GH15 family glucan-1,4-alpha-glucosidase
VRRRDGYLALDDMGMIGDGTTSALVGLDGGIPWLCLPRFDSEPLFCGLLDAARGGSFTVAPDEVIEARQRYEPDTAVLVTELRSPTGLLAVTDALVLRPGTDLSDDAPAGRQELIRTAVVLAGSVRVRVEIEPRGGASAQAAAGGLSVNAWRRPDLDLHVRCNRPLGALRSVHELHAGERIDVVLSWGGAYRHHRFSEEELLAATARSWRRWMQGFDYEGLESALVRRSALTLKLCDHWSNGALIAAPTSSLPAPVGGVRNWDYRYTWIRDASFSVYALRRIGFAEEAGAFLGWVLDTFEHGRAPKIMYDLEGGPVPDERVDGELEGYRRSAPVGGGMAPPTRDSTTSTARCSTAPTSGSAEAVTSTRTSGSGSPPWRISPWTPGAFPTRASGRYAAKAACSPTRPGFARWRWTAPRASPSSCVCPARCRSGSVPPRSCARPCSRARGTRMLRP